MPTNLDGKIIRHRASDIQPISPNRLAEIRAIPDEAIDTSDIPELPHGHRIYRDRDGRIPTRRNAIREAIVHAMTSREMTVYGLWKEAKAYCPTITETAVGEFLKGKRKIGIDYVEALLAAANLIVTRNPGSGPIKDFREAIREVDRDDGFWVHLISQEGRACSWRRYRELPGGKWGDEVIDEGVSNLYDANDFKYSRFPWVVRLGRHGNTGDFMIGGGGVDDFWALIASNQGPAFSWQFVEPASEGKWEVVGEGGLLNAYEANGRLPERFPWIGRLYPRVIEGEFMFST
jgi:hypothetical protein